MADVLEQFRQYRAAQQRLIEAREELAAAEAKRTAERAERAKDDARRAELIAEQQKCYARIAEIGKELEHLSGNVWPDVSLDQQISQLEGEICALECVPEPDPEELAILKEALAAV